MPEGRMLIGLCLVLWLGGSAPSLAEAAEDAEAEGRVHLSGALHGALLDMQEGWGGGLDVDLRGAFFPIPELGLGLRMGCMLPLSAGEDPRRTLAALRLMPGAWLRFGSAEAWGFLFLGLGWDVHLREESQDHSLLAGAQAGYAVAPRSLPFFFGFEISGELNLAGDEVRALGLGAFVGWRI